MLLSVVRLGMLVPAAHHPGRRCQLGGQSGVRVLGGNSALRGLTGDRVSNNKSPCVGALVDLPNILPVATDTTLGFTPGSTATVTATAE